MRSIHVTQYIRARRRELGLTQREVAASLGYKPQFVTNWEAGTSAPPARVLRKLCKVLETEPAVMADLLACDSAAHWRRVLKLKSGGGLFSAPGR